VLFHLPVTRTGLRQAALALTLTCRSSYRGVVDNQLLVLATLIPGGSPWASPRMIASILLGRGVLHAPATFEAGIMIAALAVHFVLAIVFALILSLIMALFRFDSSAGMASLVGAVFGLAMYLLSFYGMTRFFPWFAEARNSVSVVSHLVFGVVVADTYLRLAHMDPHAGHGVRSSLQNLTRASLESGDTPNLRRPRHRR
jgi:hypothetical protein